MRTFQKFPKENKCPICQTNEDIECVLIAIDGTAIEKSSRTHQAEIFHLKCIDLMYYPDSNLIRQIIK